MRTDRFGTPCPPEVLLSAYEVEPDTARGTGVPVTQRVADLTVLDGFLCAAVRAPVSGVTETPAAVGGQVSGELLVVEGAAVWGTGVLGTGVRGTGVRAAPHRVPLRWPPAALTALITDVGRRVFVLADGGGEIITIDLHRDTHRARPRAEIGGEIVLETAPGAGRRPVPRTGGVRPAPSMAADSVLGRVYVSDPDSRRIAVIDAHRLTALPGEGIELPARPGRLVVDEQGRTLFALRYPCGRAGIAVVDLVTGDADVLAVPGGDLRDMAYDNGSGLIFVSTGGTGSSAPGVLVIDRDTGRAVGGPIRTADAPTALAVMRAPGRTLLFCCVASTAATAHASGGSVEVVDVAHRAVVGRAPVLDGCDLVAVDQRAGDVFVAGYGSGRITRLAPRIGGTPIARHPAIACAGAGPALGGPRRTPDGTGWLQPFCRGTAVATNDIGAVLIDTDHAEDWLIRRNNPERGR